MDLKEIQKHLDNFELKWDNNDLIEINKKTGEKRIIKDAWPNENNNSRKSTSNKK